MRAPRDYADDMTRHAEPEPGYVVRAAYRPDPNYRPLTRRDWFNVGVLAAFALFIIGVVIHGLP